MAAHLPTSERARHAVALLVALGIGLVTLAMTGNDDGERALPGSTTTSAPRVLGAVVTAPPDASPAEPVAVEVPDTALSEPEGTDRPTGATRPVRRSVTTTTGLATTSTTTSPSTDPTLIPPTFIENTTTTTTEPPPPTTTTDTTEPPPPATEATAAP
jgi:hypothetical protein